MKFLIHEFPDIHQGSFLYLLINSWFYNVKVKKKSLHYEFHFFSFHSYVWLATDFKVLWKRTKTETSEGSMAKLATTINVANRSSRFTELSACVHTEWHNPNSDKIWCHSEKSKLIHLKYITHGFLLTKSLLVQIYWNNYYFLKVNYIFPLNFLTHHICTLVH